MRNSEIAYSQHVTEPMIWKQNSSLKMIRRENSHYATLQGHSDWPMWLMGPWTPLVSHGNALPWDARTVAKTGPARAGLVMTFWRGNLPDMGIRYSDGGDSRWRGIKTLATRYRWELCSGPEARMSDQGQGKSQWPAKSLEHLTAIDIIELF